MRSAASAVAIALFLAGSGAADVRLVVRADGSKVISNFGAGGSAKLSDFKWLARQHDRPSRFDKLIVTSSNHWGVDPTLVRAVIQVESDFNPRCVSNKGARGLMQLIPETARRYGVKDIFDPGQNIDGGVHYLADLLSMFHNDLQHALAAYNAGEGAVLKYAGTTGRPTALRPGLPERGAAASWPAASSPRSAPSPSPSSPACATSAPGRRVKGEAAPAPRPSSSIES